MSTYLIKGKGWRYDFTLKGTRYTEAWFETKKAAKQAEAEKRKEVENPTPKVVLETSTDTTFLDLVNLRLDHVKAYNSDEHFHTYLYLARRWITKWNGLMCDGISTAMVQQHLLQRRKISAYTANKDLRYLRATFSFGIRKKFITHDPTEGLDFFPVNKTVKYVPPSDDIDKVIAVADKDTQDYLLVIRETMARVSEINNLLSALSG